MNSYTQLHIHIVMVVKNRESIIEAFWENRLYQYIVSIIESKGSKVLAINGHTDHIHIFIGLKPDLSVSELVREIKKSTNHWINENSLTKFHFEWRKGYGAFSYSHSQIDTVVKYINNQKSHHARRTFIEEYKDMLEKFGIDYDEKYLEN